MLTSPDGSKLFCFQLPKAPEKQKAERTAGLTFVKCTKPCASKTSKSCNILIENR